VKFKSVKKTSEIKLDGVKVEFDMVDGSIKAVTLTDASGNVVRCAERGYNFYVEVPAPPETEKKYRLHGSVLGISVEKTFDDEFTAKEEQRRLERSCINESEADLKVEFVEIAVAA